MFSSHSSKFFTGFCVEGSHVLSKCKGLGSKQMVKLRGKRTRISKDEGRDGK